MTPEVSNFIPGSLEDMDKTEIADRHHVIEKQKGQEQIKTCNNNGDTFIATFYYVLLAPDLCDRLFYNLKSMNLYILVYITKGFALYTSETKIKFGYFST